MLPSLRLIHHEVLRLALPSMVVAVPEPRLLQLVVVAVQILMLTLPVALRLNHELQPVPGSLMLTLSPVLAPAQWPPFGDRPPP